MPCSDSDMMNVDGDRPRPLGIIDATLVVYVHLGNTEGLSTPTLFGWKGG